MRRRCDDNLVRVNETLMREQQVQGEVLPNPDGTCTVRLRLADDSGPLLELSLLMPAAEQGERAAAASNRRRSSSTTSWSSCSASGGAGEDAVRRSAPEPGEKSRKTYFRVFFLYIHVYNGSG